MSVAADIHLDEGTGDIAVYVWGRPHLLQPPNAREWAFLLDQYSSTPENRFLDGGFTVWMLERCGVRGPKNVSDWPLWVCDRRVPAAILTHWRDKPLTPFRAPTGDTGAEDGLSPGTRALTGLYRAMAPLGIPPPTVDGMTLWQIGALCGDDTAEPVNVRAGDGYREERDAAGNPTRIVWTRHTPSVPLDQLEWRPLPGGVTGDA